MKNAFEAAKKARKNSYSPYSKFKVGAAVKAIGHDKIYAACNVENSSFGATVCAERNAIFKMISELGEQKLEYVVLVTDSDSYDTPCGMCLQVISEFFDENTIIALANTKAIKKRFKLKDLLTHPFALNR